VYAALNELKGNDNDVLDALIPFFEPILTLMNGTIFDPHVFSAGVRKLYRWRFTGDIAATFIPRLERKGFLQKQVRTGKRDRMDRAVSGCQSASKFDPLIGFQF
jgi:hypothetical protein